MTELQRAAHQNIRYNLLLRHCDKPIFVAQSRSFPLSSTAFPGYSIWNKLISGETVVEVKS